MRFVSATSRDGWCKMPSVCKNKRVLSAIICAIIFSCYMGFKIVYTPVHMGVCPDPKTSPNFYSQDENITIVTMYLNIGTLKKTSFWILSHTSYTTDTYRQWLLSWAKLNNRVIAFFDEDDFIVQFRLLRSHLPKDYTTIIKISKQELLAFENLERVKKITEDPLFSVTYPPEYTCVMNAKYDALEKAMNVLDDHSKYIAWMDIGLFRRLGPDHPPFILKLPHGFNASHIGVSEVTSGKTLFSLSPYEIYQQNIVWVAGGFILGHRTIMSEFISAYRHAVDSLLHRGLADTDQQVLASMYSPQMIQQQKILLHPYRCPRGSFGLFGYGYLYFCLPYICKESAQCKP